MHRPMNVKNVKFKHCCYSEKICTAKEGLGFHANNTRYFH